MERLTDIYPNESVTVLIDREEELLLLCSNRHVRYEKTDLSFLNCFHFKTNKAELNFQDAAELVRTKYKPFYSTDIEYIVDKGDHFKVKVTSNIYIHYGIFNITKEL